VFVCRQAGRQAGRHQQQQKYLWFWGQMHTAVHRRKKSCKTMGASVAASVLHTIIL